MAEKTEEAAVRSELARGIYPIVTIFTTLVVSGTFALYPQLSLLVIPYMAGIMFGNQAMGYGSNTRLMIFLLNVTAFLSTSNLFIRLDLFTESIPQ